MYRVFGLLTGSFIAWLFVTMLCFISLFNPGVSMMTSASTIAVCIGFLASLFGVAIPVALAYFLGRAVNGYYEEEEE